MFGKRGEAEKILENATKVAGQTMSEANQKKAADAIAAKAAEDDIAEAAGFTEEIVQYLNEEWNERGFSLEQRIFSIALATVNLRQHLPVDVGGKDKFDEVAKAAWAYFEANKSK